LPWGSGGIRHFHVCYDGDDGSIFDERVNFYAESDTSMSDSYDPKLQAVSITIKSIPKDTTIIAESSQKRAAPGLVASAMEI
jgi:hypothetical protein